MANISLGWKYGTPLYNEIEKAKVHTYKAIKKPYKENAKPHFYVGCSHDFLKKHIEKQFLHGMNWENYGEWHIDHIIPISTAKTIKDVKKLANFTNLRPLWRKDNIAKKDKILFLI